MLTSQEILREYTKGLVNPTYVIETYLETFDKTQEGFVPFQLFPRQKEIIRAYEAHRFNLVTKPRQAGVSTTTAAYMAVKVGWADSENPENVLIIANKQELAFELLAKIKDFLSQLPRWVWGDEYYGNEKKESKSIFLTDSKKEIKLPNGSRVKAVATSRDALRGYTPTILIFDEAAFIEADGDFWSACMASLSTGGKVIVVSTPNGYDPIYYEIYDQALRNMNDFKISEMFWYRDPRYTKDLYMVKTHDLVHFLLNREEYNLDDVIIDLSMANPFERDHSIVTKYIEDGYKPCSAWFEGMVKKLKYDRRKVAQELECNFLGSGDNVFDSDLMQDIAKNQVREPQAKMMGGGLWIWKEPENGHKYVMGVDVSRGDSEDFSSIEIIDFDAREQVLEYVCK